MNKRENILSLLKRKGYSDIPVEFSLCPSQYETFKSKTGETDFAAYFGFSTRGVEGISLQPSDSEIYRKYYDFELKPGTTIDEYGIAHEPGSEAAMHMTRMRHPLAKIDSIEQLQAYPFPDFSKGDCSHIKTQVDAVHQQGLAAVGGMECTIWETSWYLRSMEELMMDMMMEDEKAAFILDKVTENACAKIAAFAAAGTDIVRIGDDVGMQSAIMMREEFYRTWLKPRLKKVIDTAKKIHPGIIIQYHSCGYVKPLINDLIEAGIDVLNPVQPECMDFEEIHHLYGDRVSFHGTIGTQTTMPFGTPEDVRRVVHRNLKIAGAKGGLLCAPTHLLEPEVPWENIIAYVEACRSF